MHWLVVHQAVHAVSVSLRVIADSGRLQAAVLGGIAFSIPVLWDAAREIHEARSKPTQEGPNSVINRRYYRAIETQYNRWALAPSSVLAGLGLLVTPVLPFPANLLFSAVVVAWFLCLGWVINWIRQRNRRELFEFIEQEGAASADLQAILASLWQMASLDMERQFQVNETRLYEVLMSKVDELLASNKIVPAIGLMQDFVASIDNRSGQFISFTGNLPETLLKLRIKVWVRDKELLKTSDKSSELLHEWANYNSMLRLLDGAILKLQTLMFEGGHFYEYFHALDVHTAKNESNFEYLSDLINTIGKQMFEQSAENDDRYSIWQHYFPESWKVTNAKLESDGNPLAKIWNDLYIQWFISRIDQINDFDRVLDTVTLNLYPEIQPNIFAKVMIFIFTPYSEGSRIETVATRKFAFGLISRVMTGSGDDHEELNRRFRKQQETEKDATLHFFFKIMNVKNALNCEVIKQCRKEVAELKKDSKGIPIERIERWERFIDLIADYIGSKSK
ncbi:MAG: hypothetical protein NVS3B3_07130 [Aquirhabdus sp.]